MEPKRPLKLLKGQENTIDVEVYGNDLIAKGSFKMRDVWQENLQIDLYF